MTRRSNARKSADPLENDGEGGVSSMRWRIVAVALLGVLLPLPLMWLFRLAMQGYGVNTSVIQGRFVVPMLLPEQRAALSTYGQDCQNDADCGPHLRCNEDEVGHLYCIDSECNTDSDCPEEYVCRLERSLSGNAWMRRCSRIGVRKEGEICEGFPSIREEGCEKGLICTGFCGRPCRLGEPSSCPEGFNCKADEDGPACIPSCEGRACPEGQRCITGLLGGIGSICMKVYGQDCELTPCPQGLSCTRIPSVRSPGRIAMECLRDCGGTEDPPCPEGTACFLFQCRQACDPQGPPVCVPGFACGRDHSSQPWVCLPTSRSE